ncbi:Protein artemis [Orchesella cincta]|uniref:Protein artemis n=1 Tax=Orchesella cincta TaxID=48709 RepID=A0A1D2MW33_ORCCI|nr:Protein artemis [Orchesella cincta]
MASLVRFHYGENNINTGPLKQIPEICVDHFFGDDLNSSVFFLSHAHTDHLVGLETNEFVRRLNQPGVQLYCHPITPILLGSFERYLGGPQGIEKLVAQRKIIPVDASVPFKIRIPRVPVALEVTVTLLPAGHCPGSVMFLFETSKFRILHTGDFRLTLDDLKTMSQLHAEKDKPKPLDHLYVDTTFCSHSANLFPNRKEVLYEAIEHLRNWISLSDMHIVHISFSAKFAHEYILLELHKTLNQKIHVTPERRAIYQHIPDVYNCVTLNNQTQLHLCGDKACVENGNAITWRLSSMWYTSRAKADRRNVSWNGKTVMLCYSMHSSLEEIAQTIDYLKPRIVTPLVLPIKSQVSEIHEAIKSYTTHEFRFEDYRSTRDVFGDGDVPDAPCPIEQDATDIGDAMDVDEDDADETDTNTASQSTVEGSPEPKRKKLDEDSKLIWQFKFSPSPRSKSSQGSSDDSQNANNSQELDSDGF